MVDEILVHISAPTTNQNDDLHRSLADEYLVFQPYRVHGQDDGHNTSALVATSTRDLNITCIPSERSQAPIEVEISILSTSKDSYGSFPSHFSSDDYNKGLGMASQGSAADAVGPTSSRLARLDQIQRHWKEQNISRSSHHLEVSSGKAGFASDGADTTFIEDTQLAVKALQSQLQSQMHDDYSDTDEDTSVDNSEVGSQLEAVSSSMDDQGNVERETVVVPSSALVPATVPQSSELDSQHPSFMDGITSTPIPETEFSKDESIAAVCHVTNSESIEFSNLPLVVFPPAPTISVARPDGLPSQITTYLAAMKTQNPTRFAPSKTLGHPKQDDRGHWRIECFDWPHELQLEFWSSLCNHIKLGRLGWGATLHRVPVSSNALGQVRLYCWAEVVEHVWLILWLSSRGRVVGTGMKWIDADGVAAYEVL